MRETWFRTLGWEDPLEKGKASHSTGESLGPLEKSMGLQELDTTERFNLNLKFIT